jgi:hypothetical protein
LILAAEKGDGNGMSLDDTKICCNYRLEELSPISCPRIDW